MNKRRIFATLYIALIIAALIALILLFSVQFIKNAFGPVSLSQLLFHLRIGVGETGISSELKAIIIKTIVYLIVSIVFLSILAWIGWRHENYHHIIKSIKSSFINIKETLKSIKKKAFNSTLPIITRPIFLVIIISISVIFYSVKTAERRLNLSDYFFQESSTWLQEHFAVLDTNYIKHKTGQKRNLILIFLESFEDGFADQKIYGENLIPELVNLKKEGISFNGYQRTVGSRYTMDGLCAQLLGVPLEGIELVDFHQTEQYDVLMGNAPSILNLLQNDGYKTSFFVGSSGKFTQKANFFCRTWNR